MFIIIILIKNVIILGEFCSIVGFVVFVLNCYMFRKFDDYLGDRFFMNCRNYSEW